MNTPSLEIKELAFAYPDGNQALYGVNLSVQRVNVLLCLVPMAQVRQLLLCI
jgi:cobalt/nickel transport system ATP-binding protein